MLCIYNRRQRQGQRGMKRQQEKNLRNVKSKTRSWNMFKHENDIIIYSTKNNLFFLYFNFFFFSFLYVFPTLLCLLNLVEKEEKFVWEFKRFLWWVFSFLSYFCRRCHILFVDFYSLKKLLPSKFSVRFNAIESWESRVACGC